jgi:hypothetical protein
MSKMKVIKKLPKGTKPYIVEDAIQNIIFDVIDTDPEISEAYDSKNERLSKEDKKELHTFLLMYANRIKQRIVSSSKGKR